MKIKIKFSIVFLALALLVNSFAINASNKNNVADPEKDKVLIYVLKNILTRGHFVVKDMNDDFSEQVFNSFIDGLDPSKRYFTQEDLKEFSQYKYEIDNQLLQDDLTFYKLVYNRFLTKIKNAKSYYEALLEEPFNFNNNETIDLNYEEIPFAKNDNELVDYWRKQLKLQTLGRVQEEAELQKEKVKKDKKFKVKSLATLEKEARTEVLKNMDELYIRIEELEHEDWFSTFLNSVVGAFDPHTTYMAPRTKERFDQSMSGKLEGIGARLQKKGIYTHIFELVSGGPAWKQGDLEAGDIILKVAQGVNEPLDIVGMRLDDAIKFIKGKKGTEVRLTVKKKLDGSIKVISIIRDVVQLDETFVKSSIVEKNGKKYAVIDLPSFYIDFQDQASRDSAKDMEKEIERLKAENVTGLIVDLRNNGGGSLKTAIEISGLFIDKGPIVQVKYRGENPIIKNDIDPQIQWEGSLVILVNEFSASASEIFAAAMQDYKRAVILGGNQTYGKGTVQNILPINQFYPNYEEDLGYLKMTIQKFYRVNGGSTQKEGVYSDIAMPSRYSYMKVGERDLEGALAWDKVPQAKYSQTNSYANFADVVYSSKQRIASNSNFKLVNKYAKWLKKNQKENSYSLNYKKFYKESEEKEKEADKFKSVFDYKSNLTYFSPKYEQSLFKDNKDLADKRMAWHKNLSKDMYISEALNVLSELKLKNKVEIVQH
ncbi:MULTISPECIES: carboxy terminal-processing peptidase [unclassified Polaribacter]|jgi:carboxyl-terminal processing protease|uniref:carboxy terminal-processing peptidase n=1 Tax=unclassified Polaribacter TaxID=196858 RepID=UPI00052B826B|nr:MULTISPECIES: carboxy terminal-processing peptidase [unclassified Polaribacter]KGL61494.1 peptidase S41 family [Polaribacter sp. Hel1_33_49]PKV65633.1 carboxyl-terminal processing protease [Polaribacter sp. Hel1_33_96]